MNSVETVPLSQHFSSHEFACNCCGCLPDEGIDPALITVLENVRNYFGSVPVLINSGYRCPTHNNACGGARNSQHLYGKAADIDVSHVDPSDVYAYLDPWHEGGLGKYNTFTHVDTRGHRVRWGY